MRDLLGFQVTVEISINKHHWPNATHTQAAGGEKCPAVIWGSFTWFDIQSLLQGFQYLPASDHMAGGAFTKLDYMLSARLSGKHTIKRSHGLNF
jgi:hypothetical protein